MKISGAAKTAFKNVNIITSGGMIPNGIVIVSKDKIKEVYPAGTELGDFDGAVIDGGGRYLSAGFIDLHTHGGGGHDFMDGTLEAFIGACELHARFGTTLIYPTTIACSDDELRRLFELFHIAKSESYNGAEIGGIHLEGPYFSLEYKGAQPDEYIISPRPDHYEHIYRLSDGAIARWSSAPELEGTEEFAEFLNKNNIVPSIAHTNATAVEVKKAAKMGFKLATHLYSGMSSVTRRAGFRVAGTVEGAYLCDDMAVELIADGCHLPYELLQLAHKIKGTDKIVLVTDSMRGAGMPDGESILGSLSNGHRVIIRDGVAFMPDGEAFAGSVATADRLVRVMREATELPMHEVVKMITATPAQVMGLSNKGDIKKGYDADIVMFDDDVRVTFTMVKGKIVFDEKNHFLG